MRIRVLIIIFLALITINYACAQIVIKADSVITDQAQGEVCMDQTRKILSTFGISLDRKILLKLRPRDEVQAQFINAGGRSILVAGFYQPMDPETIWIVSGKPRNITVADMAHEFAHAWQSSNCPMQDIMIKEGFATWCSYKTLIALGDYSAARQLTLLNDQIYGEGLKLFLETEKKGGIPAVMELSQTSSLKKITAPPGYSN